MTCEARLVSLLPEVGALVFVVGFELLVDNRFLFFDDLVAFAFEILAGFDFHFKRLFLRLEIKVVDKVG